MANGCIPVIIMDDVDPVFGSILDVDSFAVRLPEERLKHIMEVLRSIPQAEVERKQRSLEKVWHRCAGRDAARTGWTGAAAGHLQWRPPAGMLLLQLRRLRRHWSHGIGRQVAIPQRHAPPA